MQMYGGREINNMKIFKCTLKDQKSSTRDNTRRNNGRGAHGQVRYFGAGIKIA